MSSQTFTIPDAVQTLDQLDAWIEREAPRAHDLADRLRMTAAVMGRAGEIGDRRRAREKTA